MACSGSAGSSHNHQQDFISPERTFEKVPRRDRSIIRNGNQEVKFEGESPTSDSDALKGKSRTSDGEIRNSGFANLREVPERTGFVSFDVADT